MPPCRTCCSQENGDYIGFDTNEFTSRSGGKPAAIKAIKVCESVISSACEVICKLTCLAIKQIAGHIVRVHVVMQAQHNFSPLVMIGDGATDLEAKQEGGADLFIG